MLTLFHPEQICKKKTRQCQKYRINLSRIFAVILRAMKLRNHILETCFCARYLFWWQWYSRFVHVLPSIHFLYAFCQATLETCLKIPCSAGPQLTVCSSQFTHLLSFALHEICQKVPSVSAATPSGRRGESFGVQVFGGGKMLGGGETFREVLGTGFPDEGGFRFFGTFRIAKSILDQQKDRKNESGIPLSTSLKRGSTTPVRLCVRFEARSS